MSLMHILRHFGSHLHVRSKRRSVLDEVPLQAVVLHSADNPGARRLQPLDERLMRVSLRSPIWRAVPQESAGTGSGTTETRLPILSVHNFSTTIGHRAGPADSFTPESTRVRRGPSRAWLRAPLCPTNNESHRVGRRAQLNRVVGKSDMMSVTASAEAYR